MADNYLEKKMESLREGRPRIVRSNTSLDTLLKRNRSHRSFDRTVPLSEEDLKELLSVVPLCASGMNAQTLRFRLVPGGEAPLLHPFIRLGSALPEEKLPREGEAPQGYIAVTSTRPENRVTDIDLGIALQSILLKAVERGLNGVIILNFDAAKVQEALELSSAPLALVGLGKGLDRIFLLPVHEGDSLSYYRKEGVHFVPKLTVDDLIL